MGHYRNFTRNRGQRSNGSTAVRSSQSSPHSTTRACPQTTEPVQRSPSLSPHNTLSENKSGKCSKSRNTSVASHGPSRHTSGQKTYAKRALESAEKNGGQLPPIV
ncbi:unnamed protein product [Arabidopsis thaliana]|uniref:(thale cress) hypothetical protein n=1 Tax=Arabidopsis thaliana TaxID=3702 RepID=A0A7G2FI14_ARATH|nr:unnamed protein product [Arabidopsis thaliana]